MTDPLITDLSLTQVAEAILSRELSSEEVTRACLDRILRHGKSLSCVTECNPEAAIKAAVEADTEVANGNVRGCLHGVPLAHKDMFYRIGRNSACGSRIRSDFIPDHTSTTLQRLDKAGALDIARLNMVEFAVGGVAGHNAITGTPQNPWNKDYIPGGSSSGAAVAVASRLTYGSLGSDTGGSIRIPAYCCGVVGLQPTYGRVSRYGAMPLSFSLDHVGVLTRTIADAGLLLSVIAGHDEMDATSSRHPVPNYMTAMEKSIRGLRIGVPENYFSTNIDDDVEQGLERSLDVLRSCGAEIRRIRLSSSIRLAARMGALILAAEGAAIHNKWLHERSKEYGPQARARLTMGLYIPATRYLEALNLRKKIFDEFCSVAFKDADLLHVPTIPMRVPLIGETDRGDEKDFMSLVKRITHCTRPFNYLGLPTLTVPAGLDGRGLPLGFQLVASPFDESKLLRVARAYEKEAEQTGFFPILDGDHHI